MEARFLSPPIKVRRFPDYSGPCLIEREIRDAERDGACERLRWVASQLEQEMQRRDPRPVRVEALTHFGTVIASDLVLLVQVEAFG